jgi:trehalose/maltose hydrolase-like predicted phosphorylase
MSSLIWPDNTIYSLLKKYEILGIVEINSLNNNEFINLICRYIIDLFKIDNTDQFDKNEINRRLLIRLQNNKDLDKIKDNILNIFREKIYSITDKDNLSINDIKIIKLKVSLIKY